MKLLNIFKQPKLATRLFMVGSIAVLLLVMAGFFLAVNQANRLAIQTQVRENTRYYLNEDFKNNDPYMTVNPDLEDMLTGPIISPLDPSMGNNGAKVDLVIFSDFMCSYCAEQEKVLKEVIAGYDGKVRLIWKDYPESKPESASYQAAVAGRCAQEQGKFWEYHDALYAADSGLNRDTFLQISDMLSLNRSAFEKCLDSDKAKLLVDDNIDEANALDITGVPFVYVNDQEIMGGINADNLKRIIDIEMNE